MFSTVTSGALSGICAYMVCVEVDMATGLPCFNMVGSLNSEVRESKERVWVALKNVKLNIPPMRITVNLSPANHRKEGTAFDLPIAVGILEAMGYVASSAIRGTLFLGELGLDGSVRNVRGVLPIVKEAARNGIRQCVVPAGNVSSMTIWFREPFCAASIPVPGSCRCSSVYTAPSQKSVVL